MPGLLAFEPSGKLIKEISSSYLINQLSVLHKASSKPEQLIN